MKNYVFVAGLNVIFIALALFSNRHTYPKNIEKNVIELTKYCKKLNSILPTANFNDLQFLKQTLNKVDIVFLGEQQHDDGSAFLAKSRLVEFLHNEMGFDVLIYEAGLYDTYNLWNKLKNNEITNNKVFDEALWDFWWDNNENNHLVNYIYKQVNSPNNLEISGLDIQFSGSISNIQRDSVITNYLKTNLKIDLATYPSYISIIPKYTDYTSAWCFNKLSKLKKDSILKDLNLIIATLSDKQWKSKTDSVYLRFFKNSALLYSYEWNNDFNADDEIRLRDSGMADNFIWLKDNFYKNRKVIIWAANFHNAYSRVNDVKYKPMGEYIKNRYGNKCYSISITSFADNKQGYYDDNIYNNKSIEYLLHQMHKPYLFLDFRTIYSNSFLNGEVVMNCLGGASYKKKWSAVTDGILYIDNMLPPTSIKQK